MKVTDNCSIRNKRIEKKLRELEGYVDRVGNESHLSKDTFTHIFMMTLELFIDVYKTLEDNTTPAKTLLDYTGVEVRDACFRVGAANIFDNDADYVIAVMQELGTK